MYRRNSGNSNLMNGTTMYKDLEKQKEANRLASQRRRVKKGSAMGMTEIIPEGMTEAVRVIPDVIPDVIPAKRPWKPAAELGPGELNTVAKPGDHDYTGCCYEDSDGVWKVRKLDIEPKAMTRTQLQAAIDSYPSDTWIGSLAHKELMHRLHTYSMARLKAEGYWIPSWKVTA